MYGLYAITNFIWTISLYLSNATGYLVKEAYALDFISQTSQALHRMAFPVQGFMSVSSFFLFSLLESMLPIQDWLSEKRRK